MCLSGFITNLAVHLARSPLNHSYGYASADDRATCCAIFTLKPNPSCKIRVKTGILTVRVMVTGKPLLTVEQITTKVKELAAEISADYDGKNLLAVGILRGAFMFFSDIVKSIQVPMEIDFLIVSSYIKTSSSGKIEVHADIREDIKNRHILLIEDIVDTGMSLNYVRDMLLKREPASLKICALLDKRGRRSVEVPLIMWVSGYPMNML